MEHMALVTNSLFGLNYTTEELLADSPMSFAALLEKGFEDKFAARLVNERIFWHGRRRFEGVINCPALITASRDAAQSNGSKTITYTNIINMMARCWHYRRPCGYTTTTACRSSCSCTSIRPASRTPWPYRVADLGPRREPDMLFGRPAIAREFCPDRGPHGDIVLGNWTEYLEGIREPLNSANRSMSAS